MPDKVDALVERFQNLNMPAFERNGIKVIGAWVPVDGPDNQFVYMVAFEDEAKREQAWKGLARTKSGVRDMRKRPGRARC